MKLAFFLFLCLVLIGCGLFVYTRIEANGISERYPPVGQLAEIGGRDIHFVDVTEGEAPTLPPLLFIHGASGNLRDQMGAYGEALKGQARMIFVDRPGHGYSQRGAEAANSPSGHANTYAELLDDIEIDQAVVVCHSLGCASAAAMAVLHPDKIKGLVFVAPATHPWPGGVKWYYDLAAMPLLGRLFTEMLTLPVGRLSVDAGVKSVFSPNEATDDYAEMSALPLLFRPWEFRANARDVANLKGHVSQMAPRYSEIKKPTVIITGDKDDVVLAEIHSVGLENAIEGSELVVLRDVGHKPDYAATQTVIDAIRKVAQ